MHDRQADADVAVVDYLQVPGSAAELFCSAIRFLRYRLGRRIEPLVMAFDESVIEARAADTLPVANTPVSTGFDDEDRLIWLQIDEITASGPLLPVFADTIRCEGLTDRQFADLLSSGFEG
ncbi:hypothetical protein [Mangrovicoccus algicola]|uniref:Uncharacterized protein n=1 Tax=Mangrovicoccus algicola TaxID=2771008 RepID=A0A8J7CVR7_9RHOB|nr:hypothetical protein [Mangrovicoccus algicola]MBE3639044.1 hypothetical protein [Mangrovicoccus algicola]